MQKWKHEWLSAGSRQMLRSEGRAPVSHVAGAGRQAWRICMIDVWTHGAAAPAVGLNEMCPATR